ncbi:MAG TPA: glucose-6-phosphate dehydrogenase [Geodermatophilus sp.]|nr:glucose-6-phosphate dehydrogenase [Geodermatophilus sp.]
MPDCDVIVFGGTGDLAIRKLLPALWHRDREGQLPESARIIAVSRSDASDAAYRDQVAAAVDPAGDQTTFARFLSRLRHITLDATGDVQRDPGWAALGDLLRGREDHVRVFYLATAPQLFGQVSRGLRTAGLVTPASRVVLEKPIGWDLASARAINDEVGEVFSEQQIFRIDHYLGKETVQNLLVLRFANMLLEPLWNNSWIDHVQITAAETVGTGARSGYYDASGALRDMVQNHLLQLLCLVAMEPPNRLDRDAVRDEKLKVLQALRPMDSGDVARCTVRGQYRAGAVDGEPVPGYCTELGQPSDTESFVALKAEVQNWRWAGVPFYLRTGKRLHKRTTEIVVQFKPVPHSLFPDQAGAVTANRLVIHLQPNESVRLLMMTKEPGPGGLRLRPAPLNLSFADTFGTRFPDAYERLLMDVVRGNPTLFMRRDEVEAAWEWTEPILSAWQAGGEQPRPYHAGTPGPTAAIALIERDGRTWHEDHEEEPSL